MCFLHPCPVFRATLLDERPCIIGMATKNGDTKLDFSLIRLLLEVARRTVCLFVFRTKKTVAVVVIGVILVIVIVVVVVHCTLAAIVKCNRRCNHFLAPSYLLLRQYIASLSKCINFHHHFHPSLLLQFVQRFVCALATYVCMVEMSMCVLARALLQLEDSKLTMMLMLLMLEWSFHCWRTGLFAMVVQAKPKIANRCRNECLWCVRVCVCVSAFLIEIVLPVAAVFVCILAARWFQGASGVGSSGRLLAKRLSQSTGGPRKCRVLCACVCVCVFDAFYGATQPCCKAAARRG